MHRRTTSTPQRTLVRSGWSGALAASFVALLLVRAGATDSLPTAFDFQVLETKSYGEFGGIDYAEHRLVLEGAVTMPDGVEWRYRTRASIWAPADPAQANGRALLDLPNTARGQDDQLGAMTLGDDLLFERGFVRAAVRWDPAVMDAAAGEGLRPAAADPFTGQEVGLHIVADFAEALAGPGSRLGGLTGPVELLYSVGFSQTGAMQRRLLLDPLPGRRKPLFDGSLILVAGARTHPSIFATIDPRAFGNREQAGLVLTLNAETDLVHPFLDASLVREGAENFRAYEAVGAHIPVADVAHALGMTIEEACRDLYGFANCDALSTDRWWFAARALFVALDRWATEGVAPPDSRLLRYRPDDPYDPADFDSNGNRMGGIRSPAVEAGVLRSHPLFVGEGDFERIVLGELPERLSRMLRMIAGRSVALDPTERYESHADYLAAIDQAVDALLADGFMLDVDAEEIRAQAAAEHDRWDREGSQ